MRKTSSAVVIKKYNLNRASPKGCRSWIRPRPLLSPRRAPGRLIWLDPAAWREPGALAAASTASIPLKSLDFVRYEPAWAGRLAPTPNPDMAAFAVWLMAAVKTNARYGPLFVNAASDDPAHDGKCFWPAKGFRPVYRLLRVSGCCVCLSVGGLALERSVHRGGRSITTPIASQMTWSSSPGRRALWTYLICPSVSNRGASISPVRNLSRGA